MGWEGGGEELFFVFAWGGASAGGWSAHGSGILVELSKGSTLVWLCAEEVRE